MSLGHEGEIIINLIVLYILRHKSKTFPCMLVRVTTRQLDMQITRSTDLKKGDLTDLRHDCQTRVIATLKPLNFVRLVSWQSCG